MIINLFLNLMITVVNTLFSFLPKVTIYSIPFIGPFISSLLDTIIPMWNAFLGTFPYAVVLWDTFLFVILPFEIFMIIGKFILGNRMPSH